MLLCLQQTCAVPYQRAEMSPRACSSAVQFACRGPCHPAVHMTANLVSPEHLSCHTMQVRNAQHLRRRNCSQHRTPPDEDRARHAQRDHDEGRCRGIAFRNASDHKPKWHPHGPGLGRGQRRGAHMAILSLAPICAKEWCGKKPTCTAHLQIGSQTSQLCRPAESCQ